MKKLSTIAATAALAVSAAAPGMAQDVTPDPFVSSQGSIVLSPLLIIGTVTAITILAVTLDDSSSGTTTTGGPS